MICNACRRTLLQSFRLSRGSSQLGSVATAPATSNAAPLTVPSPVALPRSPPAISSSTPGTSRPLSTPHVPTSTPAAKPSKKHIRLKSSVAGGKELRGLAYLKGKPSVLAKEDDEYPDWLWTLLDEDETREAKFDFSAMTKKQRQKHDRRQERLRMNTPTQIPLHEQSKDLTAPGDDAIASLEKRQQITKSLRVARRKGIRENNFLKGV